MTVKALTKYLFVARRVVTGELVIALILNELIICSNVVTLWPVTVVLNYLILATPVVTCDLWLSNFLQLINPIDPSCDLVTVTILVIN